MRVSRKDAMNAKNGPLLSELGVLARNSQGFAQLAGHFIGAVQLDEQVLAL